jgi:hypothetical protein
MQLRKFAASVVIGFVAVVLVPLISAPMASAHDASAGIYLCGSTYDQRCGYGGVTNSHTRAYSCDTHGDNYGFRTYYRLSSGVTGYIDDANGSSSGCSGTFPGGTITGFRVVWKRTAGWVYSPCSTCWYVP